MQKYFYQNILVLRTFDQAVNWEAKSKISYVHGKSLDFFIKVWKKVTFNRKRKSVKGNEEKLQTKKKRREISKLLFAAGYDLLSKSFTFMNWWDFGTVFCAQVYPLRESGKSENLEDTTYLAVFNSLDQVWNQVNWMLVSNSLDATS